MFSTETNRESKDINRYYCLVYTTRNYRRIWRPNERMRWFVGGVIEQNSIVKNVRTDDWTAKRAIIASNVVNL